LVEVSGPEAERQTELNFYRANCQPALFSGRAFPTGKVATVDNLRKATFLRRAPSGRVRVRQCLGAGEAAYHFPGFQIFTEPARSDNYIATIGRFTDGTIGELFLSSHRVNSSADTAARDSGVVLSIALQHGADLERIRRALCPDGQP
jgi:hypothetical protein